MSLALLGGLGVLGKPLQCLVDIALGLDHVGVCAKKKVQMSYEFLFIESRRVKDLQKHDEGVVALKPLGRSVATQAVA